MHLWTLLSVVLTILLLTLAQDNDNSDSLMSALNAVGRRQKDIASSDANINYYGLTPYRDNGDEVVYLNPGRDLNDDGQPENIGYGFQKSLGNKAFASQPDMAALTNGANDKVLEKLAVEYLENEFQNDNDANQYYRVGDEAKRSSFRERQFPDRYPSVAGKIADGVKKRSEAGPTAFRERSHNGGDVVETRRQLMQTVGRRMERERALEEAEEEGRPLIQAHLEHGRLANTGGIDLESLTENEVEEILDYLENGGGKDTDDSKLEKRYNGGAGYNFFNHGAAMNGGFGFKKRTKQRLDETEGPDNAFLYSLKYVSPEYNREAVEQMRENDGIDFSGENDEDILRLGAKVASERDEREKEKWLAATEDDEEASPNSLPHEGHSEKKSVGSHNHMPQELVVPLHRMQKKYPYDPILFKRKRMMMAKRSLDYYTSPPALHRHAGVEVRRKKDASEPHATDPQVASELIHIFSSANHENTIKIVPQIIGNHVVTKQKVVTTPSPPPAPQKQNTTNIEVTVVVNQYMKKNDTSNEDEGNEDEIELPVTMSRLEIPIEVKKKSIDWSDYFGLDRRRKKTGSTSNLEASRHRLMDDDSHMFNQYYKSGLAKKTSMFRGNMHDGDVLYKKSLHVVAQPFDTRIYDAERQQAAKKNCDGDGEDARSMDSMDTKLRNIEDLIVNEAVKYTGAHEGTTDSKEIQEVKDRVMSRLATAYNVEKMRRALGEFKSSLAAQKMSKYNPEHRAANGDDGVKKRVAFKKDNANGVNEREGMKNEKKDFTGGMPEEDHGGFVDVPMTDTMSEGYMGGARERAYEENEEDCPILSNIVHHCQGIQDRAGDDQMQFLPLCTLHQICYVCGSDASCDGLFLSRANEMCSGDVHCEKRALRTVMAASRHRADEFPGVASQCWERFCNAPLQLNQPPWVHS